MAAELEGVLTTQVHLRKGNQPLGRKAVGFKLTWNLTQKKGSCQARPRFFHSNSSQTAASCLFVTSDTSCLFQHDAQHADPIGSFFFFFFSFSGWRSIVPRIPRLYSPLHPLLYSLHQFCP